MQGYNQMKLKFMLATCLGILMLSGATQAQSNINVFWAKLKSAVVKGDKTTVANMVKFPFGMPYGHRSVRTKADFIKRYEKIMNLEANVKRCFQTTKLEKYDQSNDYFVSCTFKSEPESSDNRPILYYFTKTKAGWKFAGLDNINE